MLVKLLPLTRARWPWTLTRAPGGLTRAADLRGGALDDGGVGGRGDAELHRLLRLGRGRVGAASREQGAGDEDEESEPHRRIQATARLESVPGDRYCVEHMFVRLLSN